MKSLRTKMCILTLGYMVAVAILGIMMHGCALQAGEPTKTTLVWDVNTNDYVQAYNLYARHDLTPEPKTIGKGFQLLTPVPTNGWKLIKVIPASTNKVEVTVTNTTFFTLTASNFIGESPFSQGVWHTAKPSTPTLNIQ